jgi:hypothetical protein
MLHISRQKGILYGSFSQQRGIANVSKLPMNSLTCLADMYSQPSRGTLCNFPAARPLIRTALQFITLVSIFLRGFLSAVFIWKPTIFSSKTHWYTLRTPLPLENKHWHSPHISEWASCILKSSYTCDLLHSTGFCIHMEGCGKPGQALSLQGPSRTVPVQRTSATPASVE